MARANANGSNKTAGEAWQHPGKRAPWQLATPTHTFDGSNAVQGRTILYTMTHLVRCDRCPAGAVAVHRQPPPAATAFTLRVLNTPALSRAAIGGSKIHLRVGWGAAHSFTTDPRWLPAGRAAACCSSSHRRGNCTVVAPAGRITPASLITSFGKREQNVFICATTITHCSGQQGLVKAAVPLKGHCCGHWTSQTGTATSLRLLSSVQPMDFCSAFKCCITHFREPPCRRNGGRH